MARGNQKNLVSFKNMTVERQREIASKGGKASQEKRKQRKAFKEEFLLMLENNPNLQQELIKAHLERCKIKYGKGANAGNTAFMNLLEIIGEAPVLESKTTIEVEDMTPLANMLGLDNGSNKDTED